MAQILVVDDEIGIRELLFEILTDEGHDVKLAENAHAARQMRFKERPDMVLLDIWMPDTDGISLLREWTANGQLTMPVVMMSGHGTINTAVEAVRIGAIDFLEKPISLQKLIDTINQALRHQGVANRSRLNLANLGNSSLLKDLRRRLEQLATSNDPLLLLGELGSPLELWAHYLHKPNTPWLSVNSKSIGSPKEILRQTTGGTLFVEELSDLNRAQQKNLAFILEYSEANGTRLITATTKSFADLNLAGFDNNLLKSISLLKLTLPALRSYAEDIPEMANSFLKRLIEDGQCPNKIISSTALKSLQNYHWPGNEVQLQIVIKNLALTSLEHEITIDDIERVLDHSATEPRIVGLSLDLPLREARESFEKAYFENLLNKEKHNMTRIAEKCGLERTHLYRKLKQLGINIGRRE